MNPLRLALVLIPWTLLGGGAVYLVLQSDTGRRVVATLYAVAKAVGS